MVEVQDYELLKTPDEPPRHAPPAGPSWMWIVVAALVVATAAAVFIVAGRVHRRDAVTTDVARTPRTPVPRSAPTSKR